MNDVFSIRNVFYFFTYTSNLSITLTPVKASMHGLNFDQTNLTTMTTTTLHKVTFVKNMAGWLQMDYFLLSYG
jgi:hypothetical protein